LTVKDSGSVPSDFLKAALNINYKLKTAQTTNKSVIAPCIFLSIMVTLLLQNSQKTGEP
jgi:hypothetical protein